MAQSEGAEVGSIAKLVPWSLVRAPERKCTLPVETLARRAGHLQRSARPTRQGLRCPAEVPWDSHTWSIRNAGER